jgi:ferritin
VLSEMDSMKKLLEFMQRMQASVIFEEVKEVQAR